MKTGIGLLLGFFMLGILAGCGASNPTLPSAGTSQVHVNNASKHDYLIGPGDGLSVFVWRNPDVSTSVTVRPDGKITTPLVEDLVASGKTPAQLARDIEQALAMYIKDPKVSVTVTQFKGTFSQQIRVIGEAAQPQALSYSKHMSLLDVMIAVGGLTEFANGNNAKLVRYENGKEKIYQLRISDLLENGDVKANVAVQPGDVIIIPESLF